HAAQGLDRRGVGHGWGGVVDTARHSRGYTRQRRLSRPAGRLPRSSRTGPSPPRRRGGRGRRCGRLGRRTERASGRMPPAAGVARLVPARPPTGRGGGRLRREPPALIAQPAHLRDNQGPYRPRDRVVTDFLRTRARTRAGAHAGGTSFTHARKPQRGRESALVTS